MWKPPAMWRICAFTSGRANRDHRPCHSRPHPRCLARLPLLEQPADFFAVSFCGYPQDSAVSPRQTACMHGDAARGLLPVEMGGRRFAEILYHGENVQAGANGEHPVFPDAARRAGAKSGKQFCHLILRAKLNQGTAPHPACDHHLPRAERDRRVVGSAASVRSDTLSMSH